MNYSKITSICRNIIFLKISFATLLISCLLFNEAKSQNGFHRLFNERYGLNHKLINAITKDNKGNVWLGTEKGLVKFDGLSFCDIIPDLNKYKFSEIISIRLKGNLLFLHYRNKGCLTYNLNNFKFKEVYQNHFVSIEPHSENIYFIVTSDGDLLKYANNKYKLVYSFGSKLNFCSSVIFNRYLYIVNALGVFKFDTSSLSLIDKNNNLKISQNVFFNPSLVYLNLINNNSVYKIDSVGKHSEYSKIIFKKLDIPEKVNFFVSESKTKYSYIYNYRKLVRGQLIRNDDIRVIHNLSTIDNLQLRNMCICNKYNTLVGTNQGLLWISRYQDGFKRLNDNYQYDTIVRVRRSILEYNKNELLLFGYPSIIKYDIRTNNYTTIVHNSTFYNSIRIKDKIYVTTNDSGLVRFDSSFKNMETIYSPPKSYKIFVGLCYDSINNIIAAGGQNYLVFYDLKLNRKKVINLDVGLIKTIIKDNINNVFWIGTKAGLFGVDLNGKIKFNINLNPNLSKLQLVDISDFIIINNSELYISNIQGVYKMDLRSINSIYKLPIHDDLVRNSVGLEYDKKGKIWISTFQGIVVYNTKTQTSIHLVKDIHLLNNEFNHSSSQTLSDGSLIFGGINGYDIISPNKIDYKYIDHNLSVSTVFRISKNDTVQLSTDHNKSLKFKIGQEYLKINVSLKNIIHDYTYNYEYSFDDNVWLKGNSNNQILIIDLSPGKHILKIRSLEKMTKANVIELEIIATLPFYKTNLFAWIVTLITLLALVLYIYTLRRIRTVKVRLKNQIAMDLHDEVGTVLTKALFQSRKIENNQISNLIESALNSLRAYIYSMSNKRVNLTDFIDDISEMLNFIIIDENVKVEFQHPDFNNTTISSLLYRDLKLSSFEIFANIQKHAHCSGINVKIENTKNYLFIYFSDNGVLNDIKLLSNKGNGIDNIKKRIIRHGGDVKFSINVNGTGLKIEIKVPFKS